MTENAKDATFNGLCTPRKDAIPMSAAPRGAVAFFFSNPLVRAGVYLFESSFALAGLAAAFVILPRSLERQSRRALILTVDEAPDVYRVIMTERGKARRWTIEDYFEVRPAQIASRVMRDYAHAKERR